LIRDLIIILGDQLSLEISSLEKLKNNPRLWTAFSNIKNMSEERKKQIENDSKEFMNTI
jgi:hypothetical protein